MPKKIVLLAKDLAVATQVVEYALSHDCALEEYVETKSPLVKANGRKYSPPVGNLRVVPGGKFRGDNTLREQAYELLLEHCPEGSLQDMHTALFDGDWDEGQAKAAVHGLRKLNLLVPA